MQRIRRLEANPHGRDIVVGDLHGQRSRLEGELQRIGFDTAHDRLICVGDLVDRGPESAYTVALMDEPWFHAVRGNHDLSVLATFDGGRDPDTAGDQCFAYMCDEHPWMRELSADEASATVERLRRLPYVLEVTIASGAAGIVHAEVPTRFSSWQTFLDAIGNEAGGARARHAACWDRNMAHRAAPCAYRGQPDQEPVLVGIDHVIHGHTPMAEPPGGVFIGRMGNRYWIDTIGWVPGPTGSDWQQPPQFTLAPIERPWDPL